MPKKKREGLTVKADLTGLFAEPHTLSDASESSVRALTIEQALTTVTRQMTSLGYRKRTISDYDMHVNHFRVKSGITYLHEITAKDIVDWLADMDVSNQTKLTRFKALSAFLAKCFRSGWIDSEFWRVIKIKVDTPVKNGTTERDLYTLMSVLDLGNFVELRDATAALLMYQTGVRIGTLALLTENNFNLDTKTLSIEGEQMKAREPIELPIDDRLATLVHTLIRQNRVIRREKCTRGSEVFITIHGRKIDASMTNNTIRKRLKKYEREFGLANINPHGLRRGFAKRLLDKGVNIVIISKALGHSSTEVTTRYLHVDKKEISDELRKYL